MPPENPEVAVARLIELGGMAPDLVAGEIADWLALVVLGARQLQDGSGQRRLLAAKVRPSTSDAVPRPERTDRSVIEVPRMPGRTPIGGFGVGYDTVYQYPDTSMGFYFGGSLAWVNNNPGNLYFGKFAVANRTRGNHDVFAVFPDQMTERNALRSLLQTSGYPSLTIEAVMNKFAPSKENGSEGYWKFLETNAQVSRKTPLSDLTSKQLSLLVSKIEAFEGWRAGAVHPISGWKP